MLAESEAPMPPVFMHSSTMITRRVLRTLAVIASMSKGFRLIRSITCRQAFSERVSLDYGADAMHLQLVKLL